MNYNKTNWQNGSSGNTPINATNLNNIENGVSTCSSEINLLWLTVQNIDERANVAQLFSQYPLTSGDNEYTLSGYITEFDLLIISGTFYDNLYGNMQIIVPVDWFNTTALDARAVYMDNANASYGFAKGSAGNKIVIRFNPSTAVGTNYYGAKIVGIKL